LNTERSAGIEQVNAAIKAQQLEIWYANHQTEPFILE